MALCPQCGKEIPEGVLSCPECGASVQPPAEQVSSQPVSAPASVQAAPAQAPSAVQKSRILSYLIPFILIVIIAAAVTVYVYKTYYGELPLRAVIPAETQMYMEINLAPGKNKAEIEKEIENLEKSKIFRSISKELQKEVKINIREDVLSCIYPAVAVAVLAPEGSPGIFEYLEDSLNEKNYTTCQMNLKNISTALEMWADDHNGSYPGNLQDVESTEYLHKLPVCPAKGVYKYRHISNPEGYYIECSQNAHANIGVSGNFPAYSSEDGILRGERHPHSKKEVPVIIVVSIRDNDKAKTTIEKFKEMAKKKGITYSEIDYRGMKIYAPNKTDSSDTVFVSLIRNIMVFSDKETSARRAIDAYLNKGENLASNPAFAQAQSEGISSPNILFYLDLKKLAALSDALDLPNEELKSALAAIKTISFSAKDDGKSKLSSRFTVIVEPNSKSKLISEFFKDSDKIKEFKSLKFLPKDASIYGASNYKKLLSVMKPLLSAIPNMPVTFDDLIKELNKELGVDVEKDLLPNLTGEVAQVTNLSDIMSAVMKLAMEKGSQFPNTGAVYDLTLCKSNLKKIANALDAYADEHKGKFPSDLNALVPKYLKSLSRCPAGGKYYYAVSDNDTNFRIECRSNAHKDAGVEGNKPYYSSEEGPSREVPKFASSAAKSNYFQFPVAYMIGIKNKDAIKPFYDKITKNFLEKAYEGVTVKTNPQGSVSCALFDDCILVASTSGTYTCEKIIDNLKKTKAFVADIPSYNLTSLARRGDILAIEYIKLGPIMSVINPIFKGISSYATGEYQDMAAAAGEMIDYMDKFEDSWIVLTTDDGVLRYEVDLFYKKK
ncbi:MAG: DUF3352 domain-containing protein [Firmicutes bacterium]|nr:DUF3352 domain-containing protein [Bacillota bacterium]